MHWYKVKFINKDKNEEVTAIDAINPGAAFAKCLRENPGVTLVSAYRQGVKDNAFTEYEPPKVQRDPIKEPRPARPLRKNEKGCEFPFYDSTKVRPVQGA